jgi:predicted nucleic acid-binding protein
MRLWTLIHSWGKKRTESLEQALRGYTILGFDSDTAWRWAEVAAHQRRHGRDRNDRGDWRIAACALRHDRS